LPVVFGKSLVNCLVYSMRLKSTRKLKRKGKAEPKRFTCQSGMRESMQGGLDHNEKECSVPTRQKTHPSREKRGNPKVIDRMQNCLSSVEEAYGKDKSLSAEIIITTGSVEPGEGTKEKKYSKKRPVKRKRLEKANAGKIPDHEKIGTQLCSKLNAKEGRVPSGKHSLNSSLWGQKTNKKSVKAQIEGVRLTEKEI